MQGMTSQLTRYARQPSRSNQRNTPSSRDLAVEHPAGQEYELTVGRDNTANRKNGKTPDFANDPDLPVTSWQRAQALHHGLVITDPGHDFVCGRDGVHAVRRH